MRTISTTFTTFGASVLLLGYKGDSNATEILIDCAAALEEYDGTMAAMSITGPDETVYPGDITMDENGIVHWVVAARDCGKAGHGSARIDLVDDHDTVVASAEATTIIMKTKMQGIAPDQIADWTEAASVALQELRNALLDLHDFDDGARVNEAARQLAEEGRISREQQRVTAETARATAETGRATAESGRVTAENGRVTAESGRVTAENGRVTAESGRVSEFNTIRANAQAALSYIGPSEASSTASAAHPSGSYFTYNGILYKATADIASGDTITPGTNCAQVPGGAMGEVSNLNQTLNDNTLKTNNVVFSGEDSFSPTSWEHGVINDSTGAIAPSGKFRAYTQRIMVHGDRIISSDVPANVKIRCYFYDENDQYKSQTQWIGNSTIATAGWPYVRISARYDPEDQSAVMDISDLSGIKIQNYAYILQAIDEGTIKEKEDRANIAHVNDYVQNGEKNQTVLYWSYGENSGDSILRTGVTNRAISEPIALVGTRIDWSATKEGYAKKAVFYKNGHFVRQTQFSSAVSAEAYTLDAVDSVRFVCSNSDGTSALDLDDLNDLFTFRFANYMIDSINGISENVANSDGQLQLMNSVNKFNKAKTQTKSGITYTSSGDGYIQLNGSNETDTYFDLAEWADLGLVPGKDYYLNYESLSASLSYLAIYFNTGSGLYVGYTNLVGMNKITIPEGTTAMLLRLYAKANVAFDNRKIKLTLSESKSNSDLSIKSAEIRFLGCFGTGDCTIIKFNDGTVLVIDFGLDEQQETLYRNWGRATTELNITHIDYAIISHYHSDHIGMLLRGIDSMIDESTTFFLPQTWTAEQIAGIQWVDQMGGDGIYPNYTAVMAKLSDLGCKIVYPVENEKWIIGGAEIQFWNTDHTDYLDQYVAHTMYDYNHCSLCNYLTLGDERICFTGDIGEIALEKYKTSALPSQIFKVNHHSIGYNMVPLFMNCIMPEVSVSMVGGNTARARFASNPNQLWHEANHVPHINTGINEHNLSMHLTEHGYKWNTSCRRCIIADEGLT